MRVASTAVSLASHVALVVVAVWATTVDARPRPQPPIMIPVVPPHGPVTSTPRLPVIDGGFTVPSLPSAVIGGVEIPASPGFDVNPLPGPDFAPNAPGSGGPVDVSIVEQPPMLLTGPVPAYPDLLRQAGIQGRVVLEAVVDTAGHVEPGSVSVVASAHPAFVAPAQRSLAASLFRPGRMGGVAVRVRVRMAIDFVLRDGRFRDR